MREIPILFTGPMVKAILDGSKTMTRRVVKPQPLIAGKFVENGIFTYGNHGEEPDDFITCPYGSPGDHLWVRETWGYTGGNNIEPSPGHVYYQADGKILEWFKQQGAKWRPSIFMPRWASRLTLEVTGVRVERLQDISEGDSLAEGGWKYSNCPIHKDPIASFSTLWDSINGKKPGCSWVDNPWVWVVKFRKL